MGEITDALRRAREEAKRLAEAEAPDALVAEHGFPEPEALPLVDPTPSTPPPPGSGLLERGPCGPDLVRRPGCRTDRCDEQTRGDQDRAQPASNSPGRGAGGRCRCR